MRVGFANLLLAATPTLRIAPPLRAASCGAWLDNVYDRIDYEKALFSADVLDEGDADNDDFGEDAFIYGESDVAFFLSTLRTALDIGSSPSGGFCDLGGGKGQLALAAAREESERLRGACVSLELIPELHRVAAAAYEVASADDSALGRVAARRGSFYDATTLADACASAAIVFAYATKFESADGTHVEKLSSALGACATLPEDAIVVTVNRRLVASDGWEEAAGAVEGEAPHEDSGRATAFFWRRRLQ